MVQVVWWPHYRRVVALEARGVPSVVVELVAVVVLQGLAAALLVGMAMEGSALLSCPGCWVYPWV